MCNLQVHSLLLHHSLLGELPACIQHGAGARRAAETYGWLMMMRRKSVGLALRKSVGLALAHHAGVQADKADKLLCCFQAQALSVHVFISSRPKMLLGKISLSSLWPPSSQLMSVVHGSSLLFHV